MEARISFRNEIWIKGKDLQEIKDKWENLSMTDSQFVELISVEDENFKDITKEFNEA